VDGEWLLVGYNARDQVVRQVEPGGNAGEFGEWLTHGYDAYGRPVTLTGDDDYVTDASYDAHGRLTEVVFGNDIVTHYHHYAPDEENAGTGIGQGGRLWYYQTGMVDADGAKLLICWRPAISSGEGRWISGRSIILVLAEPTSGGHASHSSTPHDATRPLG